ncbi:hypothetical protein Hypma_009447 [Hypsizygus marmoreus]|uniref:Uncharacterized protein n=1 Tax=Hypsizygus marmoreus TaxID=39966 RepID=A0A369JT62_HYPMA|nr:hypothetical protein Hypma_009447 [Hypsizygus marmoreus]
MNSSRTATGTNGSAMAEWTETSSHVLQRSFGVSESAFFPASKDGLGDMYLHLAFRAPKERMRRERAVRAWAVIRNRHPLLVCRVVVDGDSPYFSFKPLTSVASALDEAGRALFFKNETKDELIFNYMNGPRALSDSFLSYLVLSTSEESESELEEYDLMMCAPHFTGDGTSLHQSTHDFLALLASSLSDEQLERELQFEGDWRERLPPGLETRCRTPSNKWAKAAARINFLQTLDNEIGGQTFSRRQRGPQRTVMIERAFTEAQTAIILKRCKTNGVTINHTLSVLCNVAWGGIITNRESFRNPIMMYTAINLRSHLKPHPASTYWFLALTYFNIVLPSFLPATPEVFWHRARQAKAQTRRIVQSQFLVSRSLAMADIRASRARGSGSPAQFPSLRPPASISMLPPAPSAALLGLSLIGNLDAIYIRSAYPSFQLHSVRTASRQKAGGLLLLQHTFAGKLWFNLCWDENGFAEGLVQRFWEGLQEAVEEYLV